MVVKLGKRGSSLAARITPSARRRCRCRARAEVPELLDEKVPGLRQPALQTQGPFRPFIGCSTYPRVQVHQAQAPDLDRDAVPQVRRGPLQEVQGQGGRAGGADRAGRASGKFYGCSHYPACRHTQNADPREAVAMMRPSPKSPQSQRVRQARAHGTLFLVVEGWTGPASRPRSNALAAWLTEAGSHRWLPVSLGRRPSASGFARSCLILPAPPWTPGPKLLYAADRAARRRGDPAGRWPEAGWSSRPLRRLLARLPGLARGLGIERILDLSMWATGDLLPDLVIPLDVSAEVGRSRSGATDRIEQEDEAFHRRVADAYWALARTYPDRFRCRRRIGAARCHRRRDTSPRRGSPRSREAGVSRPRSSDEPKIASKSVPGGVAKFTEGLSPALRR